MKKKGWERNRSKKKKSWYHSPHQELFHSHYICEKMDSLKTEWEWLYGGSCMIGDSKRTKRTNTRYPLTYLSWLKKIKASKFDYFFFWVNIIQLIEFFFIIKVQKKRKMLIMKKLNSKNWIWYETINGSSVTLKLQ
jgi:hypothetical protein